MPYAQTPKTTFGIELEMGLYTNGHHTSSDVYDELEFFLNHTPLLKNKWEMKEDGSVTGDIGGEIITKGAHELSDLLKEVKIVCSKIKEYEKTKNIKVDSSAGFHIHIGIQHWTIGDMCRFYRAFYASLDEWFAFQPASRARSTFCRANRTDNPFSELMHNDRYLAINPQAIIKHGTLELRLFAGTTQYYKIEKTLQVVNSYIKGILKPMPDGETPKANLFEVIDNKKLLKFILNRIKKVQKGNTSLVNKFNQMYLEKSLHLMANKKSNKTKIAEVPF